MRDPYLIAGTFLIVNAVLIAVVGALWNAGPVECREKPDRTGVQTVDTHGWNEWP